MELTEKRYASKGVGGTALGLSIGALGAQLLAGGLGNLFGGGARHCDNSGSIAALAMALGNHGGNSGDVSVNRYEASLNARIAELETENKLRDSNIYTDSKLLDVYKYFDGENKAIRAELAAQAVKNAQIEGTFAVIGEQTKALRNEFMCALNREKDERCCGDNSIVTYLNATFYPKLVADVTAGTTTTAQPTYNPVFNCGGCK